jgi:hypothetical protein
METMAITAGCRVWISVDDGLSMDTLGVTVIGMAGGAFLDHTDLVPFPGGYLMDLFVAISTLNIINEMGAGIMFCRFFFMATMAGDRLGMDFCPFFLDMLLDIGDIPVATVTGVCSVHRLGKCSLVDLLSMAT